MRLRRPWGQDQADARHGCGTPPSLLEVLSAARQLRGGRGERERGRGRARERERETKQDVRIACTIHWFIMKPLADTASHGVLGQQDRNPVSTGTPPVIHGQTGA